LKQNNIRNDESLRRAQDIEFVGRALVAAKKITYTKETLVYYRTDTETSNVKRLHQHPYDVIRALQKLKSYLDTHKAYMVVEKSFTKIAVSHVLANLYFIETDPIHKSIYKEAKKFFANENLSVESEVFVEDQKALKEIQIFMTEDYEGWLRYRIADLRDDSESKYISYLLGEFQRKYAEEVERYQKLQSEYDALTRSLSWKVTKPLRQVNHRYGKKDQSNGSPG
jgi:hypothetical protein